MAPSFVSNLLPSGLSPSALGSHQNPASTPGFQKETYRFGSRARRDCSRITAGGDFHPAPKIHIHGLLRA